MWLDLGDYHGPSHFHAFLRYCTERTRQRGVARSYQMYVTNALQNIPQGKYMSKQWSDLIEPHKEIDVQATIDHVVKALEEE